MLRIEKRKWDGSISAVVHQACLVDAPESVLAWFVPAGAERISPAHASVETLPHDELWVTATDEWWVLCAEANEAAIVAMTLHAAVPVEVVIPGVITWIDLDLDFVVHGEEVSLRDEAQFHCHAARMSYPREVIRGAWVGIARLAPCFTTGEWPFDGWLEWCVDHARAETGPMRSTSRR